MRFRIFKIVATTLIALAGITCLGVALFAYQLGLDNNVTLGTSRKILAGLGFLLLLAPLLVLGLSRVNRHFHFSIFFDKIAKVWGQYNKPSADSKKAVDSDKKSLFSQPMFCSAISLAIVFLCSVWYITSGNMFHFRGYSNYFDLQADGFLAGQTSLTIKPPAELAKLADPYDWRARTGIKFIWDASYYQGNYYLYWGAVPALIAALVKIIHPVVVEDQHLLLFFVIGITIFIALILAFLRKKYFPSVPAWTMGIFTLLGGLATPLFWLVNRPNVYETAIASCQFFLIMGLYALIRGLDSATPQRGWFLLAGFSFGAAVGSRTSIVFTVIFVVFIALVLLIKKAIRQKTYWLDILMFLFPLVVFAAGIAWLNFTRFGSIFETGLRYQLTGDALPEDLSQLFAFRYFLPNLYLNLLQPFAFTPGSFPFFIATADNSWTRFIRYPKDYFFGEQITGILYCVPFLWLLIVPAWALLRKGWRWVKETPITQQDNPRPGMPIWMWVTLIGGFLTAFLVNMMYLFSTMRYLADYYPILLIITCVLLMGVIERSRYSRLNRGLLLIAICLLSAATIVISLFINFTCGDRRMLNENPALYTKLEQFFNKQ